MQIISEMINELSKCFQKANAKYFNNALPEPVITIAPRHSKGVLGYITIDKVWSQIPPEKSVVDPDEPIVVSTNYELAIISEGLNRPIENVMCTLVHEMCHLYNLENNIKDGSGKIHNKHFKSVAESCDLIVEKGQGVGYGVTSPSDKFKEEIAAWDINESVFGWYRKTILKTTSNGKKKPYYKYTSPSDEKIIIKSKIQVVVTDVDTGECFDEEYINEE